MNYPIFFDSKNTISLFGLKENLNFLSNLHNIKKLPKVLMISGNKGSGKSTLVNHLLFTIFDKLNYDFKNHKIIDNSDFINQFKTNTFPNIVYLKGADFKSIKIEDIRNLKNKIFQTTIVNKNRFIIADDVELFNINSLNALLKIIEEPTENNYFILINNKSKQVLETIKSRTLEIKIILNEKQRIDIITNLVEFYRLKPVLNAKRSKLSPGNYLKFDFILQEYKIPLDGNFVDNLSLLLNLYKKNKDILFVYLAFFLSDNHFQNLKNQNIISNEKIYNYKNFISNNLNNFLLYNINQNTLINSIDNKLKYE